MSEARGPESVPSGQTVGSIGGDAVAPPPTGQHRTPTRISASWTAVVAAVVILIVLVVFIGENTQASTVNFVGFHGRAPTAVVLLIAALSGAVIVLTVGLARILQLRHDARHSGPRA